MACKTEPDGKPFLGDDNAHENSFTEQYLFSAEYLYEAFCVYDQKNLLCNLTKINQEM